MPSDVICCGLSAIRAWKACSKKAFSRASSLSAAAVCAGAEVGVSANAGAADSTAITAADEIRRRRMNNPS